jgi:hypothetical protein
MAASSLAALVRYRPTDHRGTAVDTVMAANLTSRSEDDVVDSPSPRRRDAAAGPRSAEQTQVLEWPAAAGS